jgi:hypothetical protein
LTDISEEYVASIFRVKDKPSKKPAQSKWQAEQSLHHAGFLLGLVFDPEDGSNMLLQNVS